MLFWGRSGYSVYVEAEKWKIIKMGGGIDFKMFWFDKRWIVFFFLVIERVDGRLPPSTCICPQLELDTLNILSSHPLLFLAICCAPQSACSKRQCSLWLWFMKLHLTKQPNSWANAITKCPILRASFDSILKDTQCFRQYLSKSHPTIFTTFQNRQCNNQKLACCADVEKQRAFVQAVFLYLSHKH